VTRRGRPYGVDPARFDSASVTLGDESLQALMEAPPLYEPPPLESPIQPLIDALTDALDAEGLLDPRELWVLEALFWRGLSYRQLAKELGLSKTHVHRIARGAMAVLADVMSVDHARLLDNLGVEGLDTEEDT
jgi:DNA-directed RNA polymerase specialized sigma24 family protein